MAEGTLTVADIAITGLNPAGTLPTVTDGDKFINTGKEFLQVVNDSGGSINVTISSYPTNPQSTPPSGLTVGDQVVAVPAGQSKLIGPFPPSIYSDTSNYAHVVCSAVTDILIKALRLTPNPG
jgi:hypothetical protein